MGTVHQRRIRMGHITGSEIVGTATWKGNPLLVIAPESRRPFQFGLGKARKLLEAVQTLGAEEFADLLRDFVDSNSTQDA